MIAAGTQLTQPSREHRPCRILVVDDDYLVRGQLCALLSASQYQVEAAASGEEALRVLHATECHIVLTDWQMPDMDGLALCRQVRLSSQESYIYLLMLTIRGSKDDMLTGFAAGADDYMVKGATIDEILARLEVGRRVVHEKRAARTSNGEDRRFSYTDPSTGAHNLEYLMQHLPRELARSQRYGHALAVLSCDIGGFQQITDQYGAEAGDEFMREFVARVDACIREGDWLARTRDREFMIVLPETSAKGANCVAQKLRQLFPLQPRSALAEAIRVTVRIGVTAVEAKHDADSTLKIQALLRAADRGIRDCRRFEPDQASADTIVCVSSSNARNGGKNELN